MSNPVRKAAEDIADATVYSDIVHKIKESIDFGTALAETDFDLVTVYKLLGWHLVQGLAATEPGRRLNAAWRVLNGRPVAYKLTVFGSIRLTHDVFVVDCVRAQEVWPYNTGVVE